MRYIKSWGEAKREMMLFEAEIAAFVPEKKERYDQLKKLFLEKLSFFHKCSVDGLQDLANDAKISRVAQQHFKDIVKFMDGKESLITRFKKHAIIPARYKHKIRSKSR